MAFSKQLDELRTDYVDLLLLNWPHCWAPAQHEWGCTQWRRSGMWKSEQKRGSWRALEEFYREGKARAIGVSNFTIDHLEQILNYSREAPHVMQCESHPHWPNKLVRNWCRKKEVAFQGYAPFGGQSNDRNQGQRAIDCPVVNYVAEKNDVSASQVCMYWSLSRNDSVVVKSKTFQRLRENLRVPENVRLPGSHLAVMDKVADAYKEFGPVYWGHNDVDRFHPWQNEELMMADIMNDTMSSPHVNMAARRKSPAEYRASSWAPDPPPGAAAPGDMPAQSKRAGSLPPGAFSGFGDKPEWREYIESWGKGGRAPAWKRSPSREARKGPATIPEE